MNKPNKRAKGDGSVYRRASDNMWIAKIELPPGLDGKRRRKTRAAKTEAKAKVLLQQMRRELLMHGDLPTATQPLGLWMDYWYDNIQSLTNRSSTLSFHQTMKDQYIKPAIGNVRLDQLKDEHVQRLLRYVRTKPKDPDNPDKGFLSSRTVQGAYNTLALALRAAKKRRLVLEVITDFVDKPRKAQPVIAELTALDAVRVMRVARGDRLGSRWIAALLTGARQGELLGLEWDRVDFGAESRVGSITISWQLQRISWRHGCGGKCGASTGSACPARRVVMPEDQVRRHLVGGLWLTPPKTSKGFRVVPLVEPLLSELQAHFVRSPKNAYGLVWANEDGSPIDPSRDSKAWHALLVRAGVPDVPLHAARHTAASLLLAAGVAENQSMLLMGHSTVAVTRGYQVTDMKQLARAMDAISALVPYQEEGEQQ